ncbi:MAG: hypothetical protein ACXABF_13595 [Candidatus Thorarchaeota archaeon]|jgi:hypothetical protein
MYSERQENWTRIASLVVSFIFVGFAIVLWWSLTVASIVLLVAAISIWIFSICNFEVYVEPTWIDTDATERRESKPREYRYGDPTDLEERISKMIDLKKVESNIHQKLTRSTQSQLLNIVFLQEL